MSHSVDIHVPGASAERRPLDGDAVWVLEQGRGVLCGRGETRGSRPEVELVPGEHGVLVKARAGAAVRIRVHGSELSEAIIPWGDEVFLDDARLAFVTAPSGGRGRPLLLLLALLGAVGVVVATSRGRLGASVAGNDPVPPPLPAAAATCSATGGMTVEARAFDAERSAAAKRARYAFDVSDGVAALPLYDEAAACFREAGRIEDARRATAEADAWRTRLDADYASLVLELRAARAEKRVRDALRAARDLEALLASQPEHPYTEWLRGVRRELEQQRPKSVKK